MMKLKNVLKKEEREEIEGIVKVRWCLIGINITENIIRRIKRII
jgi:hypothetical protein